MPAVRRTSGEASHGMPIEGPDQRDEFLLQGLEEQGRAYGFAMRNVTPDRWLAEGDSVALGDHRFDVLHCPGHTPGHVVFVNHAARFAMVGDVLFQGSIGRTDFPYGDHAALIRAITEKLLPLGDDFAFLCGHGPGSTHRRRAARQSVPALKSCLLTMSQRLALQRQRTNVPRPPRRSVSPATASAATPGRSIPPSASARRCR